MRLMKKEDMAMMFDTTLKDPGIVGILWIVQEHSVDRKTLFQSTCPELIVSVFSDRH